MRAALIVAFLANVALAVVTLDMLPDRVAIHFGSGGLANGWGSKYTQTMLTLIMDVFFFCMFYYAPRWATALPPKWVNLPNRDYWLSPDHKAQAREKLAELMWPLGVAFFLFFLAIGVLTLRANQVQPPRLDETLFLGALAVFMLYMVWWTVAVVREFRIPRKDQAPRL